MAKCDCPGWVEVLVGELRLPRCKNCGHIRRFHNESEDGGGCRLRGLPR